MFIEPNLKAERRGWIEVICGSMFSGKTEELIRRLKRVKIANLKVEIFKPAIDVRYDVVKIVSHDTNAIQSTPIDNSQKILPRTAFDCIIDENSSRPGQQLYEKMVPVSSGVIPRDSRKSANQ